MLHKDIIKQSKNQFPTIYQNLRDNIKQYNDFDFKFLRKAVKNIPYFRTVNEKIIQEVVYMLTPKIYEAGSIILRRGDEINEVYLLGSGAI